MSKLRVVMNSARSLTEGEQLYNRLSGLFCIYKPPDMDLADEATPLIKHALVNGINLLPCRPVEHIVKIDEERNEPRVEPNLADAVEAVGARYIRRDFMINFLHPLDKHDSGVQIVSLNDHQGIMDKIYNMRLMRVYEIKCRLGVFTSDFTPHGRLVERATYLHVNASKIDRLMASIQATYQREMFKHVGVDPQSQEAFDMACIGPLKPKSTKTPPQIYSIRCVEYDRPFFKLEVHTINESTAFLRNLVHDIGVRLKAYAICVQLRRVRDGFADIDSSLSYNHWELPAIEQNTRHLTQMAQNYMTHYDKTSILGKTRKENKFVSLRHLQSKYNRYDHKK